MNTEIENLEPPIGSKRRRISGWCLGSDQFRKELLAAASERVGRHHYGPERRETLVAKAERIIAEELKHYRCADQHLEQMRKGDKTKVAVARRLRRETTMTYAWIAERLKMGSWAYVSNLLNGHYAKNV